MKTGLVIFFSFLSFCGFAQPAQQSIMFEKVWGDPWCNYMEYADELTGGDFLLIGTKHEYFSPPVGIYLQYTVCRMDRYGNILWEKDFGTNFQDDWLTSVLKTKQGNYILLGGAVNAVSSGNDVHAIAIDQNGDVLFDKYYYQNTGYSDYIYGICETHDNSFLISCGLGILPQNKHTPTLIKIDSEGNELWRVSQDSLAEYQPRYIESTPDNGCLLTGNADYTNNFGNSFVAKFNAAGNLDWIKYPFGKGDSLTNYPSFLFANSDGTFNVPFSQEIINSNERETKWVDFDVTGNSIGVKVLPFRLKFPTKSKPAIDPFDSTWIISNQPFSYAYGWIYKIDKNKNCTLVYQPTAPRYIGGGEYVIRTADKGYFSATAYTPDPMNICAKFSCVKFSSDLRYTPEEYPEAVRVFPNPSADGIFNLRFDMKTDDYVDVKIHSVDGKLVFSDRFFCPANTYTEYPVHLDLKSGSSGMYFFEAKTSASSYFKKLITVQSD